VADGKRSRYARTRGLPRGDYDDEEHHRPQGRDDERVHSGWTLRTGDGNRSGPVRCRAAQDERNDGYEAVALAFGDVKKSRVTRALSGHYKKAGLEPKRSIREFRTEIEGLDVGSAVAVDSFVEGDRVDVQATSKGHGFAGGIKRWNFSGGGASHGSMIIVSRVRTATPTPVTRRRAAAVRVTTASTRSPIRI